MQRRGKLSAPPWGAGKALRFVTLVLVAVSVVFVPEGARADVTIQGTNSASTLADAIIVVDGEVSLTGAEFGPNAVDLVGAGFEPGTPPPADEALWQNGVGHIELGGFPTGGSSFAILTNGNVEFADDPNEQDDRSHNADGQPPPGRGAGVFDVTTLRIDVSVPPGANCLSLDYRFLSEEFPEYVGQKYNDAFIVELDTSDWLVGEQGEVIAPSDFATATGQVVSVNGVGPADVSAQGAEGTTYDAATALVTTETPITPGPHSVYLSIFDVADHEYDSAVFVDRLDITTAAPGSCFAPGLPPDPDPPPEADPPSAPAGTSPPVVTSATPQPTLAESVVVTKVEGTVKIKRPGQKSSVLLATEEIPVGSIIDARKGVVTLITALPGGGTQSARFFGGIFVVKQRRAEDGLVELALKGAVGLCSSSSRSSAVSDARKKRKRKLWGDGSGKYRTRGRHSAGTVRGTRWLTQDSCDGTLTKVRRGSVSVRDFAKRKTVLVKAGDSYLAKGKSD